VIPPAEFVPIAEDAGILPAIERQILQLACGALASWQRQFELDPPLGIAVNISPRRFQDDALLDEIAAALEEHGLAPGTLKLEITESMLLGLDAALNQRSSGCMRSACAW
jgi:EAL domain-containing protein (putative c-di-GMP-specific phosphodiesterase class I)